MGDGRWGLVGGWVAFITIQLVDVFPVSQKRSPEGHIAHPNCVRASPSNFMLHLCMQNAGRPFPPSPPRPPVKCGPPGSFQQPARGSLVLSHQAVQFAVAAASGPRLGAVLCRGFPPSLLRLVDEHAESLGPADREGLDIGPPHHQRLRVVLVVRTA